MSRRPAIALALCALLVNPVVSPLGSSLGSSLGAQQPSGAAAATQVLRLRLAGPPGDGSQPGWQRVRDDLLPRLGVSDHADGPLEIVLTQTAAGTVNPQVRTAAPSPSPHFLQFTLEDASGVWLSGHESADGAAVWQLAARAAASTGLPPRVAGLARRYAFEVRTGWLELDLVAATAEGAPSVDDLPRWLALDCGDVAVLARPQSDGSWTIRGRGNTGLLLPALLASWLLPPDDDDTTPTLADDLQHWLGMARASHGDEREEAARQLGRFDDPRAIEALADLLWEDDRVGRFAALSLAGIDHRAARNALWQQLPALATREPGLARHVARAILPDAAHRSPDQPTVDQPTTAARAEPDNRLPHGIVLGLGLLLAGYLVGRHRAA